MADTCRVGGPLPPGRTSPGRFLTPAVGACGASSSQYVLFVRGRGAGVTWSRPDGRSHFVRFAGAFDLGRGAGGAGSHAGRQGVSGSMADTAGGGGSGGALAKGRAPGGRIDRSGGKPPGWAGRSRLRAGHRFGGGGGRIRRRLGRSARVRYVWRARGGLGGGRGGAGPSLRAGPGRIFGGGRFGIGGPGGGVFRRVSDGAERVDLRGGGGNGRGPCPISARGHLARRGRRFATAIGADSRPGNPGGPGVSGVGGFGGSADCDAGGTRGGHGWPGFATGYL